jgi:hypothetical protein
MTHGTYYNMNITHCICHNINTQQYCIIILTLHIVHIIIVIQRHYIDLNSERFENVWFYNCNVYAKLAEGSRIKLDIFDNFEEKLRKKR